MRGRKPVGPTMDEAIRAYIAACRLKGNVATWVSQSQDILERFCAFHGQALRSLKDAQPYHLTEYLGYLQRDRGNASATICRRGMVIRAWARWCRKSGIVPVCALADAELPREHQNPVEVAELEVYRAALEAHPPNNWADEFRVYLGSGLRRSELLYLRWEDIDLEQGLVHVRRRKAWSPKGKKDRIVGLTQDARQALARICARRKRPESLGPYLNEHGTLTMSPCTITNVWNDWAKKQNLPPRLHALRHAHATAAVERGAILTDVQAQLGHAKITTTMRYVKQNPEAPRRVADLLDAPPKKDAGPDEGARPANKEAAASGRQPSSRRKGRGKG